MIHDLIIVQRMVIFIQKKQSCILKRKYRVMQVFIKIAGVY